MAHEDNSNLATSHHDGGAINTMMMKKNVEEANLLTQELNDLGLGADISSEVFHGYLHLLPRERDSPIDTSTELDFNQLDAQNELHELYRVKYYKSLQQVPRTGSKMDHDEMINQYPFDMSKQLEEVLMCFENDGTLDSVDDEVLWEVLKCFDYTFVWYFHPEYCMLAALDDYQRIVIKNDGMYANWDRYHQHFNTYDVEKQYVKYYAELSKKLKWMEDYVLLERPSLKWGRVSNRGIYQAVKIATGFPKITAKLAYLGIHELVSSMNYDVCFFKELDGVYFEIWQRVTKQKMSFRDALKEVYELNRFPVQQKMKYALEINDCSQWEAEFHTCTACITEEVAEDEVLGLIAEAVKKLRDKPRFYDDYIRKKMDIARAIGLITTARKGGHQAGLYSPNDACLGQVEKEEETKRGGCMHTSGVSSPELWASRSRISWWCCTATRADVRQVRACRQALARSIK